MDELEGCIRELYDSMKEGSDRFGRDSLPCMAFVERSDTGVLPFKELLREINETHRKGLDVEDS